MCICDKYNLSWERSGSVVECLTRAPGSSFTGVTVLWPLSIYPSLVLVQRNKARPCLTERLLMGRKESIQTNKIVMSWPIYPCPAEPGFIILFL